MTYAIFDKLRWRAKTADFFPEPFITSSVFIFYVSNKAIVSDMDYWNLLSQIKLFKNWYKSHFTTKPFI